MADGLPVSVSAFENAFVPKRQRLVPFEIYKELVSSRGLQLTFHHAHSYFHKNYGRVIPDEIDYPVQKDTLFPGLINLTDYAPCIGYELRWRSMLLAA